MHPQAYPDHSVEKGYDDHKPWSFSSQKAPKPEDHTSLVLSQYSYGIGKYEDDDKAYGNEWHLKLPLPLLPGTRSPDLRPKLMSRANLKIVTS